MRGAKKRKLVSIGHGVIKVRYSLQREFRIKTGVQNRGKQGTAYFSNHVNLHDARCKIRRGYSF